MSNFLREHSILVYVLKRLLKYVGGIFFAFTVSFWLFRSIPGNPIQGMMSQLTTQYVPLHQGSAATVKAYTTMFGLDQPIYVQYLLFLKNAFLHGDLGLSLIAFPVHSQVLILQALPYTLGLFGTATLIAWALGVLFGALLGWRRDSKLGKVLAALAIAFSQIPYYILAIFLLLLLAFVLNWLPASGAYTPFSKAGFTLDYILDLIRHAALPGLSVVIVALLGWLISSRALIISILGEDYLLYAEAKGLQPGRIFSAYALRNALLPQVTGLAMSLGFVVNGAYVVESMFLYPGVGGVFVQAVHLRDFNTLQGVVLMSIVAVLTANLLIDLLLPLVDPRVRPGGQAQR